MDQFDRRDFLKLAGLGGAVFASGLPGCASLGMGGAQDFHFVQLSDVHWGYSNAAVNPEFKSSLHKAIAQVNSLDRKPDFVVFSGPAIVPILDPGDRRIDSTRLSKDPEVQRAYMEDPLVLRERVTDELFVRLADGLAYLPGRAGELAMPTLLIHGGDDLLCSAEGAEAWLRGSNVKDLTAKIYAGGRHEMFNETNRDEVLADLWDWMQARLG